MQTLAKGANAPLPAGPVAVRVRAAVSVVYGFLYHPVAPPGRVRPEFPKLVRYRVTGFALLFSGDAHI